MGDKLSNGVVCSPLSIYFSYTITDIMNTKRLNIRW